MDEARWYAVLEHRDRLLRLARPRCPTREDAEDVVQEAMLRCAGFADLDEKRLGPFLTSVTIRLCADVYRGAERYARAARRVAPVDETEGTIDPEHEACRAAEAGVVRDLVSRLPSKQRAVLVDRARGMSVQQISRRHELTYKATESALTRARATMRAALASGLAVLVAFTKRGRTAAIAAVPAAAMVLSVGAVLRGPLGEGGGGTGPAPRAEVSLGRREVRDVAGTFAEDRVAATPVAVRQAVRPVQGAPRPAPGRPKPKGDPIFEKETPAGKTTVRDDRKHTYLEFAEACASEGAWFELTIAPGPVVKWKNGCGKR